MFFTQKMLTLYIYSIFILKKIKSDLKNFNHKIGKTKSSFLAHEKLLFDE